VPRPVEGTPGAYRDGAEDAIAEGKPAVGRGNRIRGFAVDEDQWKRRNASVPLVPPKPNELESASSIFMSRAVSGT
jgi:hypothetical protein